MGADLDKEGRDQYLDRAPLDVGDLAPASDHGRGLLDDVRA